MSIHERENGGPFTCAGSVTEVITRRRWRREAIFFWSTAVFRSTRSPCIPIDFPRQDPPCNLPFSFSISIPYSTSHFAPTICNLIFIFSNYKILDLDIMLYLCGNINIIFSIIETSLQILFFGERARVCRRRSMDSIGFSLSPSIDESWLAISF